MRRSQLQQLPSVDRVLQELGNHQLPRSCVLAVVRRELAAWRKQKSIPNFDELIPAIRKALGHLADSRIRPVINGTGILIHTNLGRAPLGPQVIEAMSKIGASYNTLEYDFTSGARGSRGAYLEHNLALLCEAEAATVVNNNAAALVLVLRHFCGNRAGQRAEPRRSEVIISRGELIEIGGGFRIPEMLESSGATLREIGTTNKTSLEDYSRAINGATALILKVHRSNCFMDGFVKSPKTKEIAALARKKRVPLVEDLGSGAIVHTEIAGLEHEPTPAETLRHGVDLVCFSGDKLFGGPQAGIIAGRAKLIAALKREPFFRALRCDKLILAALQTIVDLYLHNNHADGSGSKNSPERSETHGNQCSCAQIPVLQMLQVSNDELRSRAETILAELKDLPLTAGIGTGQAQLGGGTLPRSGLASITIDLAHSGEKPHTIAARLRERSVPVIGYIGQGKVKIDLRTVFPWQDAELISAIKAAS